MMLTLLTVALWGTSVALRLIVNPGSVGWMSWLISDWDQLPLAEQTPQTLTEIRAAVTEAGLAVGNPIHFSTYPGFIQRAAGFNDILLPIYRTHTYCEFNPTVEPCQRLVELRVYRPQTKDLRLLGEPQLELFDRFAITEPEERFVVAPLVNAAIAEPGSSQKLPLTTITFVEGEAPLPGAWIQVSGMWQRGNSRVRYGQVIHYDPTRIRLQPLQRWTSPAEQFPRWQLVTENQPHFVVNQTIGLEPQFQVYKVSAGNAPKPIQMQPITLAETGLDDHAYQHGLLLARNGLWSFAQQQLEASKATNSNWSTVAQAQLDLVLLHAVHTKKQADRDWANPRQQMLALLMDGRWTAALTVLQAAHTNGYTLNSLINDPTDRFRKRVEIALRLKPDPDLQAWGMLLTAIQEDQDRAIAWLNQQPQVVMSPQRIQELLAWLNTAQPVVIAASPSSSIAPSPSPISAIQSPSVASALPQGSSQIFGTAVRRSSVEWANWLQLDPELSVTLGANQTWYEIQVLQMQTGQQWQAAPFPHLSIEDPQTTRSQWQLGLNQTPQMHLTAWNATPQTVVAIVVAVQLENGDLKLLAMGDALPASFAVAMSPTMSWMQPSDVLTLAQLNQQNPEWTNALLPVLWQALQTEPQMVIADQVSTLFKEASSWRFQLMDLTGDGRREGVLTIAVTDPATSASVAPSSLSPISLSDVSTSDTYPNANFYVKTLIFSSHGSLLYNDLNHSQSLKAIVNLDIDSASALPVLIVAQGETYRLEQWSMQNQQFESIVLN
jgi:hypothetical protein